MILDELIQLAKDIRANGDMRIDKIRLGLDYTPIITKEIQESSKFDFIPIGQPFRFFYNEVEFEISKDTGTSRIDFFYSRMANTDMIRKIKDRK